MLQDQPFLNILLINILLGAVWHYAMFFLCIVKSSKTFSPHRKIFQPHKWEHEGRYYENVLKIKKWKDILPQHIGKDGFSKDHIDDVSLEYIDEFILETCRAEWDHSMNCLFAIVILLINDTIMGAALTLCLLLGNVPFVCIQRYKRFRLQKFRKVIIKKQERERRRQLNIQKPDDTEKDNSENTAAAAVTEQI